uniref:Uncharacterized protein n=1 Tax=Oryza meridionalis TaxID=40149 RepID=A0A0E0DN54_9ORYZ
MLPSSSTAACSVSSETASLSRSAAAAVVATLSTFLAAAVTSGLVSNGVEEHTGPRYLTHWL